MARPAEEEIGTPIWRLAGRLRRRLRLVVVRALGDGGRCGHDGRGSQDGCGDPYAVTVAAHSGFS